MMKKFFLIFFLSVLHIPALHAQAQHIIFLFPGGQGSTEAAQPLLDLLAAEIKTASQDKIDTKIIYFTDLQEGLQFIANKKPIGAIIGIDTYEKHASSLGAKTIATTLQLPSADGRDQFFLAGKKGSQLPTTGTLEVYSPRSMDQKFVSEKLFPNLSPLQIKMIPTENAIGYLRSIGRGTKEGVVLLDAFEHANLFNLKTPWTAELDTLAQSQKISAAPFVVFEKNATPAEIDLLQKTLTQLHKNPSAKPILEALRLKGFK